MAPKQATNIKRKAASEEKKGAKKARVELTPDEAAERVRIKQAEKAVRTTKKNIACDYRLIAKSSPTAKVNIIQGRKLFICPITGDASEIMYALPLPGKKPEHSLQFKGSFASLTIAFYWLKQFLLANCGQLKHHTQDKDGAMSLYNDIRKVVEQNYQLVVPEYAGPLAIQAAKKYTSETVDAKAKATNYPGIVRIGDESQRAKEPKKKDPSYALREAIAVGDIDCIDESVDLGDGFVLCRPLNWKQAFEFYNMSPNDTDNADFLRLTASYRGVWDANVVFAAGKNSVLKKFVMADDTSTSTTELNSEEKIDVVV